MVHMCDRNNKDIYSCFDKSNNWEKTVNWTANWKKPEGGENIYF